MIPSLLLSVLRTSIRHSYFKVMTTILQGNITKIKKRALVYVKDIGEGGTSSVYQATWRSPNGNVNVAVKKLLKKNNHELEVLSRLSHPNVVQLIGVVDEKMDYMLILELCEGGNLRSYLEARKGRQLPEKQFYDWTEQAAKPIEYLRKNNLVHKDIKSPNYMVTSQNTLKLGDFGIAKENIVHTIENATGTTSHRWMAPELLLKGILSPKFDIFALAVVLWELWTGRLPWEEVPNMAIYSKICMANERLPLPEDCPKPIKELLIKSWQTEWKLRPDIVQVLQMIRVAAAASAAVEIRRRHIIDGPWNMVREIGKRDGPGKLQGACNITLSPDGDVVVADKDASQIKIYSLEGEYKSGNATHSNPVAVGSDNTCFMTDWSQRIAMYELGGKFKGSWVASCPDASSYAPVLHGLAIDHADDLLLGDIKNNYIYKHRQDGTHVASIKVCITPRYIAVTSQDTIVIAANWHTVPQVISNKGQVLHTLKRPAGVSQWDPLDVYCHAGIIFVSEHNSNILCYGESGKYLGSILIPSLDHYGGIVMTSERKILLFCDNKSVKVFTPSSV